MAGKASLNHGYRTVWSDALGAMVAVACGALSQSAWANPTGGTAVLGSATFSTIGNQLTVTTSNGSHGSSAINWQSFSIAPGETTYFQQPSASSTVLNRVVTATPSQIFGSLGSNGRVLLVNQSGITIGAGAVVDTAGFTAAAMRRDNDDVGYGAQVFGYGGALAGDVRVADGARILAQGAGGDIVLLGANVLVEQGAQLQAPNGNVILGAGQTATLTGRGLDNISFTVGSDNQAVNLGVLQGSAVGVFAQTLKHSGSIQATAVEVDGGRVLLKASQTATVEGSITATKAGGAGGVVDTSGAQVLVNSSAAVNTRNASGTVGTWTIQANKLMVATTEAGRGTSGLQASTLATALGNNHVALVSTDGAGGITLAGPLSWADQTLRLGGAGAVRIQSALSGTHAGLVLDTAPELGLSADGSFAGQVNLDTSSRLQLGLVDYTVVSDLAPLAAQPGGRYALGRSFDAGSASPIGDASTPFTGELLGLGHTVSALSVQSTGTQAGLFGAIGSGGAVSDLRLDGASVRGAGNVGVLAGSNAGTIRHVSVTGASTVAASNGATGSGFGGLVGYNSGTIRHAQSAATVNGTNDSGGLVGVNAAGGSIVDSFGANESVAGRAGVGGLVGSNAGQVSSSYSGAALVTGSGAGSEVGGLVGSNTGTVTDTYAISHVQASAADSLGGLVGTNQGSIQRSYASGQVNANGATSRGGLVGRMESAAQVQDAYWDTQTTGYSNGIGLDLRSTGGGLLGLNLTQAKSTASYNWGASSNWFYLDGNTRPMLRMEYGQRIGNAHQLQLMAMDTAATYTLAGDFNMGLNLVSSNDVWGGVTGKGFVPIVGFSGALDGNGHSVAGLTIDRGTQTNVGLFGSTTASASIRNLALTDVYVVGGANVGALVGYNNGGSVDTSFVTGYVSGASAVGALVGRNTGAIASNYATATVTATGNDVGGLVGRMDAGSLSQSYADNQVSGAANVGALVGRLDPSASLSASFWNTEQSPGLVGVGNGASTGAVGLESLTSAASYTSWGSAIRSTGDGNPAAVWRIYDGYTGPLLVRFLTPLTVAADVLDVEYNGTAYAALRNASYTVAATSERAAVAQANVPAEVFNVANAYQGVRHVLRDGSGRVLSYAPALYSSQSGYDIRFDTSRSGALTIQPRQLSVSASKTYDGTVQLGASDVVVNTGLGETLSFVSATASSAHARDNGRNSITAIALADGTGRFSDYALRAVDSGAMAVTVQARQLSAQASITAVAKEYDGGLLATGSSVTGTTSGALDGDTVALDTSAVQLRYSDAHVATANKTISASGTVAVGALSSQGSGDRSGRDASNRVVADAGDYSLAALPTIAPVAGVITPRALQAAARIGGVLTKTYDGSTAAPGATLISSVGVAVGTGVAGDRLSLQDSGVSLAYNDSNVQFANTIGASGPLTLRIDASSAGSQASDYQFTAPTIASAQASITPLQQANWNPAVRNGLWNNAANWDVLPSSGNVLEALIPAGVQVTFDGSGAPLSLQALRSDGAFIMRGGSLSVSSLLSTTDFAQTAASSVGGAGSFRVSNSFVQSAGSIAMGGAVDIHHSSGALRVGDISGARISLSTGNGAISQTAALVTPGLLSVSARGGGISLTHAGNAVRAFTASTTDAGDVALTNRGALELQGMEVANGNVVLDNTGALVSSGAVHVPRGGIALTTHSPLTVNADITASGNIALTALTPAADSNMVLNGDVRSSTGDVAITVFNNLTQNSVLSAAQTLDVQVGGSLTLGPLAFAYGNPVRYTVGGQAYTPAWTRVGSLTSLPEGASSFLDDFQLALNQSDAAMDDPLGLKKRSTQGLLVEDATCKP